MFFPFYDPTILIILPAFILAIYAQIKVKNTFNKYSKIRSNRGFTGAEVAREILNKNGLSSINIQQIRGQNMGDHYDPKNKVLNLSSDVYNKNSLAAIGVAAHEAGHALQDAQDYRPLMLRNNIVPVANIGSRWGLPLAIFGFFFQSQTMILLGIIVFLGAVVFHLVTLPVEFNASNRAIKALKRGGYLTGKELQGAKKVLRAAAFTYVAATFVALANLFRIILLFGMGGDD